MPQIDPSYFNVDKDPLKANSVEDILAEDESILVRLQPNRKVYVLESIFKGFPVVAIWVALDVFVIIMMTNSGAFQANPFLWVFIVGFFALHLLPLWIYIARVIKNVGGYKNIEYVFTDKRIIIRSGLIGVDFKFIYYSAIQTVTVKVGLFDRMFKVGDLHIIANGQTAVLDDIDHPYQYSTKIEKIVLDIKTDMSYPNDLRPEENHGYNTKYKG